MTPKKGLVGKELKPAAGAKNPSDKAAKPGSGKPPLGSGKPGAKELPARGTGNHLDSEEVARRLRVHPGHVEAWLRDGILRGTPQSIQVYELEKFKAKHHKEIQKAQHGSPPSAPAPGKAAAPAKEKKASGKSKAKPAPAERSGPSPLQKLADAVKGAFKGMLFSEKKPAKLPAYPAALSTQRDEPTMQFPIPVVAPADPLPEALITTATLTAPLPVQRTPATDELMPPPPPSTEVWPSLEGTAQEGAPVPNWLASSAEAPVHSPPGAAASPIHETLILKSDQLSALRAAAAAPASARDEKQRNQQLLEQLQEQRRVELELQDEIETLKQRLELSLSGERETRLQLKRSRQELQAALGELEQRPPAGGFDPESQRVILEMRDQWETERSEWLAQREQLMQRKVLLEQQIERLRSQAEEIRQHGLQWHQLATQQDQQLRQLRQQHADLERQAGQALEELESSLRDSEEQLKQFEQSHQEQATRIQALENQLELASQGSPSVELQLDNKAKDRAVQQLRLTVDQLQSQLLLMENQQRAQIQRWEQELQASAGWVQKLTDAVAQRDRRIQEQEIQLSQSVPRGPSATEEELKSQLMSLRVELNSLRRNYEIVSLQSRTLEKQLQESQRPQPASARPAALSLDFSENAAGGEDEGGFRRRLNARLRSLGSSPQEEPPKKGLEPPPFLELDIPES